MAVYVPVGIWVRERDVIRLNADRWAQSCVGITNSQVLITLPRVPHAPERQECCGRGRRESAESPRVAEVVDDYPCCEEHNWKDQIQGECC